MKTHKFQVEEVTRDGFIAWDAVDLDNQNRVALQSNGKRTVGSYPEITRYLSDTYGITADLTYQEDSSDAFSQALQEWKYVRGDVCVVVNDIVRTVAKITFSQS